MNYYKKCLEEIKDKITEIKDFAEVNQELILPQYRNHKSGVDYAYKNLEFIIEYWERKIFREKRFKRLKKRGD